MVESGKVLSNPKIVKEENEDAPASENNSNDTAKGGTQPLSRDSTSLAEIPLENNNDPVFGELPRNTNVRFIANLLECDSLYFSYIITLCY